MTSRRTATTTQSGVGVDKYGGAVIDPTKNVLDLVDAAVARQDDLLEAANLFMEAELRHVRLTEGLRADHARELAEKEANRLDAIRQVDVLNQTAAARAASDAIQVLAATTANNAEKLRNDLNATATLMAKQTADVATSMAAQTAITMGAITDRLSALEKSSYQGVGRSMVSDPIQAQFMEDMKRLMLSQSATAGKTEGISTSWAILISVITIIIAVIGVSLAVIAENKPAATPQVVYMPSPATPTTTTTTSPAR